MDFRVLLMLWEANRNIFVFEKLNFHTILGNEMGCWMYSTLLSDIGLVFDCFQQEHYCLVIHSDLEWENSHFMLNP